MKLYLGTLFFLCTLTLWSQPRRVLVQDSTNGQALPFVNVVFDQTTRGTVSDEQGRFEVPPGVRQLKLSYVGYESLRLAVPKRGAQPWVIQMMPRSQNLTEVTVTAGINPALRIVNQAIAHRDQNNPEQLESFRYESYSKFYMTGDSVPDQITRDSLLIKRKKKADTTVVVIDSSNYEFNRHLERHHLFVMETVTRRTYKAPRDHEEVLAQRTSGFKNPIFAYFVTQFQSLSLYNDFIGITGINYSSPIARGAPRRYYFILEDTAIGSGNDTTFFISFRPQPGTGVATLRGVMGIHSDGWALANFRARPASGSSGFPLEIIQKSQRYGDSIWFPKSLEARLRIPLDTNFNQGVIRGVLTRQLLDVELQLDDLRLRDVSKDQLSMNRAALKNTDSILASYRTDSLDSLSVNAYRFMDSVGEANNLDRGLDLLLTLASGKVSYKFLDVDLASLLRFSQFEEIRPGLGLSTNEELSRWFSIHGYAGYGFGDKRWKHRGELRIHPPAYTDWEFYGGFEKELYETGNFELVQLERQNLLQNEFRNYFILRWDFVQQNYGGLRFSPWLNAELDLSYRDGQRRFLGGYRFLPEGATESVDVFQNEELVLALSYAPGQKTAQLIDQTLEIAPPKAHFTVQYRAGQAVAVGRYDQLTLATKWQKIWPGGDRASVRLMAGQTWGAVPASRLFIGEPAMRDEPGYLQRSIAPASMHAFETMRFFEFLSSRYTSLSARYDLGMLWDARKKLNPNWVLVQRAAWGDLRRPEQHLNLPFQTLDRGFYESGLEVNNLIKTRLIFGYGLGFFYRYGPLQRSTWDQNLAVKLTLRTNL